MIKLYSLGILVCIYCCCLIYLNKNIIICSYHKIEIVSKCKEMRQEEEEENEEGENIIFILYAYKTQNTNANKFY